MKRNATLVDVARLAGVSIATVSRVINGSTNVSPELVERINTALRETNYHPNVIARSLRNDKTFTVGLLVPDITNSFFAELAQAASAVFDRANYTPILCDTQESVEKEKGYYRILLERRVDGLLVVSADTSGKHVEDVAARGIPVVLADRTASPRIDSVRVDNFEGAAHAVSYLISKGYRTIAGIFGPQDTLSGKERRAGYIKALESFNMSVIPDLVKVGPFTIESGFKLAGELLQSPSISGAPARPDAIFAANKQIGIGAFKAIKHYGFKIPGEVALIVFDDFELADYVEPPITVVAHPAAEIGRRAAELLLERIGGSVTSTREVLLKAELVVRGSA